MPRRAQKWTTAASRRGLVCLCLTTCLGLLAACFQPDFRRECLSLNDCRDGEVCLFSNCVPERMDGSPDMEPSGSPDMEPSAPSTCEDSELLCDQSCVDPQTLEFCGSCQGCPELSRAEPTDCVEATCAYTCQSGFFDANGDLEAAESDGCECRQTNPSLEVCDGVDNDCNGEVDDAPPETACRPIEGAVATECADGACVYACQSPAVDANDDLAQGRAGDGCECTPSGDEVCDGLDNDCDGSVDADDLDFNLSACPIEENAEVIACLDSTCAYRCDENFVDTNQDLGLEGDGCDCNVTLETCGD